MTGFTTLTHGCRIGFGAMHLSDPSAAAADRVVDPISAAAVVHAALDSGVRLIDTADAYCTDRSDTGHNERLVAAAVRSWPGPDDVRRAVVIATKGGHVRGDDGSWDVDGRPEHLAAAARASWERLGGTAVRLYQFHRPDPCVPWRRSVTALRQLQRDGIVEHVGLSNVTVDQLDEAAQIVEVAAVQNELSPFALGSIDVVEWCHRHDVPFLAWAPLGGARRASRLTEHPALDEFHRTSADHGVSVARTILAWLLSLSPMVVPIPGSTQVESVLDAVAAATLRLEPGELVRLDDAARAGLVTR